MRWPLALAVLAACGGHRSTPPFSLRIALAGPLLPITSEARERPTSSVAQTWVFEPLALFDERGALVPKLAAQVERISRRKLRVRLRPELFSDGAPLTEADVIRSLALHHLRALHVGDALEIDADDNVTPVDLLLVRTLIARPTPGGEVGTGPFSVTSQSAEQIVLARRTPREGFINEVVLRAFATEREAFVRTLRGDADLLRLPEPRDLEFFDGVPRLRVIRAPGPAVHAVAFNPRRLGREERSALVRALRPDSISSVAYGAACVPVLSRATGAPPPPGRRLDILVPREIDDKLALAVRRALGGRGGEVRALDLGAYFDALKAGDFDLAIARPLIWPPSAAALSWRSAAPTNYVGYSNPRVDAALDEADWDGAQRELDADPPAAFFCTQERLAVVDARVRDARLGPYDFFETLPEWQVSP